MAMRPVTRWPGTERASLASAASARPLTLSASDAGRTDGHAAGRLEAAPRCRPARLRVDLGRPSARVAARIRVDRRQPGGARLPAAPTATASMRSGRAGRLDVPARSASPSSVPERPRPGRKIFADRKRQRADADLKVEGRPGLSSGGDAAALDATSRSAIAAAPSLEADRGRLREGGARRRAPP